VRRHDRDRLVHAESVAATSPTASDLTVVYFRGATTVLSELYNAVGASRSCSLATEGSATAPAMTAMVFVPCGISPHRAEDTERPTPGLRRPR
jgi:hypothetical protein